MSNVKEISLRLNVDRPEASSSSGTKQPSSSRDRLPSYQPSTTKDGRKVSSSSMNKAHPPSFQPPSCPPPAYQTHALSQRMSSQRRHINDGKARQSSHGSSHREHASRASSAYHHSSHADQKRNPGSVPAKSHRVPSVVQPSLRQPSHATTARQQCYAGASQYQNSSHHHSSHHHASQHNDSNQHSSMRKPPLPSAPPHEPSIHHSSMRKPPIPESIYKPSRTAATTAPPTAKSIFKTKEDLHMASRQTQIESMRPEEREKQEEWAQSLIRRAGVCPEGYTWTRMSGGYQCNGSGHGITDELLAEGKGGLFALPTKDWNNKQGPYYPGSDGSGKYYSVVKSENHGSTRSPG